MPALGGKVRAAVSEQGKKWLHGPSSVHNLLSVRRKVVAVGAEPPLVRFLVQPGWVAGLLWAPERRERILPSLQVTTRLVRGPPGPGGCCLAATPEARPLLLRASGSPSVNRDLRLTESLPLFPRGRDTLTADLTRCGWAPWGQVA